MEIDRYIEIVDFLENLKNNTRHSWTSTNRRESVAEHSLRLAMMAYFIKDEYQNIDANKLILMCIFHDLGEVITGDIPSFEKTDDDRKMESEKLRDFLKSIDEPYRSELLNLFDEMEKLETEEAKLYKALDRMEAVIQHNSADLSTWIPLEFELNKTYGEKEANFSDYTRELRKKLKEITEEKIKNA